MDELIKALDNRLEENAAGIAIDNVVSNPANLAHLCSSYKDLILSRFLSRTLPIILVALASVVVGEVIVRMRG